MYERRNRPAGSHLRRARRSDAPRDSVALDARRSVRERAGRAVRPESAHDFEAPQGTHARWFDRAAEGCAVPSLPPRCEAARAGVALARRLPPFLGRILRPFGSVGEGASRARETGKTACQSKTKTLSPRA